MANLTNLFAGGASSVPFVLAFLYLISRWLIGGI